MAYNTLHCCLLSVDLGDVHHTTLPPPSAQIASGFDDGTVRLWDARQGGGHRLYAVLSPSAASDPVVNVSLRLGTYQLFSAHKSGAVRVWDLRGRLNDSRRLDAYKHKTCSVCGFITLYHTLSHFGVFFLGLVAGWEGGK